MNCFAKEQCRYWPSDRSDTPYMDTVLRPIIWNGIFIGYAWKPNDSLTIQCFTAEAEGGMN